MAETLVPADAEAAVVAELNSRLPALGFSVPVRTTIPGGTKPTSWVRVLAVGGTARDLVGDLVTLVIEGWSTQEVTARQLCASAVAAIEAAGRDGLIGDIPSGLVRTAGFPANLPDPNLTTHRRYSATITAGLRRSVA